MKKLILLSLMVSMCFFLSLSQSSAEVALIVGDGSALPGSTGSPVGVSLDNPDDGIQGIKVDVCDVDDYLSCTTCDTTERTTDLSCSTNELPNGCCRVLLFSFSGDFIEEGSGPVFTINYDVLAGAPSGDCRELNTEGIEIVDVTRAPLTDDLVMESGEFCFSTLSSTTTPIEPTTSSTSSSTTTPTTAPTTSPPETTTAPTTTPSITPTTSPSTIPSTTPTTTPTTTTTIQCKSADDCEDDGKFCNGDEICVDGSCNHSGDPCPEGTTCFEGNDECRPIGLPCDISISPATAEVVSGQALSFTLTTEGDCDDPDYEWSLESTIKSSIDQNGNYKADVNLAPYDSATEVVSVVDRGNGDISAEATVTVSWGCSLLQIYGENSEEVKALRSVRDNLLSQTPDGRELIKMYYQWNPLLVKMGEEDEEFKEELKEMVDGVLEMIE